MSYYKNHKGITIITLIITIVVTIILAAIGGFTAYNSAEEAVATKFKQEITDVKKGVETVKLINAKEGLDEATLNKDFDKVYIENLPDDINFVSFDEGETTGYLVDLKRIEYDKIKTGQEYKDFNSGDSVKFDVHDVYVYDKAGTIYYLKGMSFKNDEEPQYADNAPKKQGPIIRAENTDGGRIVITVTPTNGGEITSVTVNGNALPQGVYETEVSKNGSYTITATEKGSGTSKVVVKVTKIENESGDSEDVAPTKGIIKVNNGEEYTKEMIATLNITTDAEYIFISHVTDGTIPTTPTINASKWRKTTESTSIYLKEGVNDVWVWFKNKGDITILSAYTTIILDTTKPSTIKPTVEIFDEQSFRVTVNQKDTGSGLSKLEVGYKEVGQIDYTWIEVEDVENPVVEILNNRPGKVYEIKTRATDNVGLQSETLPYTTKSLNEIPSGIVIEYEPKNDWTKNVNVTISYPSEAMSSVYEKWYKLGGGDWKVSTNQVETLQIAQNMVIEAVVVRKTNTETLFGDRTSVEIKNIDSLGPEIGEYESRVYHEDPVADFKITVTARDNESGIAAYAVTTSKEQPTQWIQISPTKKEAVLEFGIQAVEDTFLWVKDVYGNISTKVIYEERIKLNEKDLIIYYSDSETEILKLAYDYIGRPVEPQVTVYLNEIKLAEGKTFSVEYKDNINIGEATIIIKGIGAYEINETRTFKINPVTPTLVLDNTTLIYDRNEKPIKEVTPIGVDGGTVPNGEVTYTYYKDSALKNKTTSSDGASIEGGAPTQEGTYYAIAYMKAQGNYLEATSNVAILKIEKNEVIVTFDANEGTVSEATRKIYYDHTYGEKGTLPSPTRTGYTFGGWYKDKTWTEKVTETTQVINSNDHSIYAKWNIITYTIGYTLNGGTATNPATYNIETPTFTLNNPTRLHYTFLGWTGSNGTTASTSVSIENGSIGDKNYTANWKQNVYVPSSFTATNGTTALGERINISWGSNSNLLGTTYELLVSEDNSNWTSLYKGAATTYTHTGLAIGNDNGGSKQTRYYKVRAKNSEGTYSAYTAVTTGNTLASPSANISVTSNGVNSGTNNISISWSAVPGAKSYVLSLYDGYTYRSYNIGNVTSWNSNDANVYPTAAQISAWNGTSDPFRWDGTGTDFAASVNDLNVKSASSAYNDLSYFMHIHLASVDSNGNLSGGIWAGAKNLCSALIDTDAPNIPGALTVGTRTSTTIAVSASTTDRYMTANNPGSGIASSGYRYKINSTESSWTTTSYTYTGLTPNTSYSLYVQAKDNNGNYSGYSTAVSARTLANIPTSLSATNGTTALGQRISVSWGANSNPSGTTYELQVSENNSTWTNLYVGTATSYDHTGLATSQTRYYRVRAKNDNGEYTSYTTVATGNTLASPSASISITSNGVNSGTNNISISWSAVAGAKSYVLSIFDGYQYRSYNIGNVTSWNSNDANIYPTAAQISAWNGTSDPFRWDGTGTDFAASHNNLYVKSADSTYNSYSYYTWIHIASVDSSGSLSGGVWAGATSLGGGTVDTDAPNTPGAPTVGTRTSTTIAVSASTTDKYMTANHPGSGIPSSGYRYKINSTESSWTTTSYTHTGLTPNTSYSLYVQAKDNNGNYSGYSGAVSARTLANIPTSLSASNGTSGSQISISWGANSNPSGTTYELQVSENNSTWTNLYVGTATSYSHTGLSYNMTRYYRVRAKNANNEYTSYTSSVTGKTMAQYSISYNLNGGSVATANPTLYTPATATFTLNNPTRTGYTFKGWTGSNGTTAQTSVSIAKGSTGNKSYTANWTANQYTVNLNANGGSVSPTSIKVTYDSTYSGLPTASRTYYRFDGWFTSASGGTQVTTSTKVSITGTQTLYAHWTQVTCKTCGHSVHSGACQVQVTVAYTCTAGSRTWVNCSTCGADGKVNSSCGTCGGDGKVSSTCTSWSTCSTCGGDAKIDYTCTAQKSCTTCGGDGKVNYTCSSQSSCTTCGGDGKVDYTCTSWSTCGTCGGDAKIDYTCTSWSTCSTCGGDAKIDYTCTSWSTCSTCGGDAKIDYTCSSWSSCGTCGGDGYVNYTCTSWSNCSTCGGDGQKACTGSFSNVSGACGCCGGPCVQKQQCSACGAISGYCYGMTCGKGAHSYGGTHGTVSCSSCSSGKIACSHGYTSNHTVTNGMSCSSCGGDGKYSCTHGYNYSHTVTNGTSCTNSKCSSGKIACSHGYTSNHTVTNGTACTNSSCTSGKIKCTHGYTSNHTITNGTACTNSKCSSGKIKCTHGYTSNHTVTNGASCTNSSCSSGKISCTHGYTSNHTVTNGATCTNSSCKSGTIPCGHGNTSSHVVTNGATCTNSSCKSGTIPCTHGNTSSHVVTNGTACTNSKCSSGRISCTHGYTQNHSVANSASCTNCGADGILENSTTCGTCSGNKGWYTYSYCEHDKWEDHSATKQQACGCTKN